MEENIALFMCCTTSLYFAREVIDYLSWRNHEKGFSEGAYAIGSGGIKFPLEPFLL